MGWLGGGILTTLVLAPNVRKLPQPAALEFNAKVLPKLVRFVQVVIGATLLFGILLLGAFYGGNFLPLSTSSQGMELSAGIGLALATAIIAWGVTLPSFMKVSKIANQLLQGGQQAPSPELLKYGKRARVGSTVGLILLLIVLATMVGAGFGV